MDICSEIEKLIEYSIKNGLVNEQDRILITNMVAGAIELDTYREFSEEEINSIKKEVENTDYPYEILNNIVKWAGENGRLKNDTVTFQDLMNSKIMGQVIPRT